MSIDYDQPKAMRKGSKVSDERYAMNSSAQKMRTLLAYLRPSTAGGTPLGQRTSRSGPYALAPQDRSWK
jgi:hypothetical protein